jgi:hypothetical protein
MGIGSFLGARLLRRGEIRAPLTVTNRIDDNVRITQTGQLAFDLLERRRRRKKGNLRALDLDPRLAVSRAQPDGSRDEGLEKGLSPLDAREEAEGDGRSMRDA